MSSCVLGTVPSIFTHIICLPSSDPKVTVLIFLDGKREVTGLTPGHTAGLQKNSGLWPWGQRSVQGPSEKPSAGWEAHL